ncbi:hypothetical protein SLEP1_g57553 [Rubroshorea leprosula]|uniref:Uncharacterized protein n=1 Tax=Rubroshorea leprosula TaxID=152421 RepID=A0AAV5MLL8_9ROSI|nr:hypothetical protein SLEP1_g57553 [Rubroshorea leprosula]
MEPKVKSVEGVEDPKLVEEWKCERGYRGHLLLSPAERKFLLNSFGKGWFNSQHSE